MDYIHKKPLSLKARILKIIARVLNLNKILEKKLDSGNFSGKWVPVPPGFLHKEFSVKKNTVHNRNVFTLAPKNEFGSHFILYLHGGAYVNNFLKQHWDFVSKLIPQTNASIILPDYPLAPESTYKDTLEMVFEVYKDMLSSIDPKNIIFMGDSAGAGLALAMAQKMKIDDIQQPKQIILLSPWLDVSMSNPEAKTIEKRDVLLNIKSLRMAARSYAANTDLKNYLMSPIYGSMSGLAKNQYFYRNARCIVS
jgi:acetyl esterase/lipase